MRAIILVLAFGLALSGQTPPALDVVLLVEDSVPATRLARRTDLSAFSPGDRLAVMTFSGKQSLKLPLEEDYEKVERAIGKLDGSGTRFGRGRVWDAVAKAAGMLDGPRDPLLRRAIFVVFSGEDNSTEQTPESVREALLRNEVSLNAVTIWSGRPPVPAPPLVLQTPKRPTPQTPGVWSDRPPLIQGSALDDTLRSVEWLAMETGGLRLKNEMDFTKLAEHARGH